jgi:hypothetical protein
MKARLRLYEGALKALLRLLTQPEALQEVKALLRRG